MAVGRVRETGEFKIFKNKKKLAILPLNKKQGGKTVLRDGCVYSAESGSGKYCFNRSSTYRAECYDTGDNMDSDGVEITGERRVEMTI